VTWADVAVAAAFVLGVTVGGIAVIRVTRYLLDYLRNDDESRGK
jgi:hypothetical protein